MRFAYGTNGLADHRLSDALTFLADTGYDGVSLTLDHGHLDPYDVDVVPRVKDVRARLDTLGLAAVVETGARFLLDPRAKHEPTLVSNDGRERRIDLLRRAIVIARDLGAPVVSMWSGVAPPDATDAFARVVEGVGALLGDAEHAGVTLGFEPEPGMTIDTIERYEELARALGSPPHLGITLDIGHCRCNEVLEVPACVERVAGSLVHVQIEDMKRGVHEHLPFGEGEIDFPPVLRALDATGYDGLVSVELPRHSHTAHTLVPASLEFLREAARA